MKYSLKKRKPIVYISLAIYFLLSVFIIAESSMTSSLSTSQSTWFTNISAFFVNLIEGPRTLNYVKPDKFLDIVDSSYLGKGEDGISNIAIGTTTYVSIPVSYPQNDKGKDILNHEYTIDYKLGNKGDYNLILSPRDGNENIYYIDMRIVANKMSSELYQIDVKVAETITYEYKFHIVPLAKPINYEAKIDKTSLKIGETAYINTKLISEDRDDYYLRRYFDTSKIDRSSSNEDILTIDNFGVIHAKNPGNCHISYGKYTFDIEVKNESIVKPSNNSLSLSIDPDSKQEPCLLDYDYVFGEEDDPNDYSCLVYADFSNKSLSDQSVSFSLSDDLCAKLAPYKYDEDGYPVYKDDSNRPCVRVSGYRKKDTFNLNCFANADDLNVNKSFTTTEASPVVMNINLGLNNVMTVNAQKVITASFNPKNVNNKNIDVTCDNEDILSISNNGSSAVTLTAKNIGKATIKVTSKADPTLVKTALIEVQAGSAINENNYSDFHSFIRKAAGHFMLFLVTSVIGYIFFYTYLDDKTRLWTPIAFSLGSGLFLASLSELIQFFVPGRNGAFLDIGIDFLGYIVGTAITFGVLMLIKHIRKRTKSNSQKGC